ncbi:MAG TPA: DUF4956 domain-containing protein [Vicinamibacteria bacterium]
MQDATPLQGILSPDAHIAVRCTLNMLLGGALAIYVRVLYRRFGSSISNRDAFSSIFPILTMVTVAIIFVVKSSLALSLGLVGALSIVRFRAAIKNPEELVYLFLCIGIGIALGAEHRLLALMTVLVVSAFVLGRHLTGRKARRQNLLLSVTGDAARFFEDGKQNLVQTLEQLTGGLTIQRFDLEDGEVQFRANVVMKGPEETTRLMSELRTRLPGLQVSYVNLESFL